jgi:hypothetical protein
LIDRDDDWEGILDFPQNRTLYVDQFSGDGPILDNAYDVFSARDMDTVFEKFHPEKEIELHNEDGEYVSEQFHFRSIDDFEDEQLIAQSELLSTEESKINTYNDIIRQIEKNKNLRSILSDESTRDAVKHTIAILLNELQQRQVIEHPISEENFVLLKGIVKHVENMDPSRKAAKNVFLSDVYYADLRQKLNNDLLLWASILEQGKSDLNEMLKACKSGREKAELNLQNNLLQIHEDTYQLEVTYRTLDSFFANVGQPNTDFLTLMDVSKKELLSNDSEGSLAIQKELKKHYDALSLKNSYSLFVIPGYLGDTSILREWAKTAHNKKVLLVTDFKDCESFKTLKDELEDAHLQGHDVFLSNVVVTCNYLLGRKKSELAYEDDDVYSPGSGALAGRMVNTKEIVIAQGVVGKDFGILDGVQGTRLNLLKAEIAVLVDQGVVPLIESEGRTIAISNRSLYNGSAFSLQEYPIVRVLDWVNKVLMNYMHEIALETWDPYISPKKLDSKIRDFLDHYRGYQLLFSGYKLNSPPKQDPKTKIVSVDISITPFFAAKNFVIKLEADNKNYMSANTSVERQP